MAEEESLAQLILEALRRRRKATLTEIIQEIFREPRPQDIERVRRLMARMEAEGSVARHVEPVRGPVVRYVWYDARPLRRIVARNPGRTVTETQLSQLLGIPKTEIPRLISFAAERGWLKPVAAETYRITEKIYRVQKMRAWRTSKSPWKYFTSFGKMLKVPRQLVLDNYAPSEETPILSEGVHGAVRIVVYTAAPEKWPESRLETIMRGLFAQEGITLEIFSNVPYIDKTQAYEAEEIDIDEKPPELELDEVDVWLWIAKEEGYTLAYHYVRRPWGWTYERYEVR